MRNEWVWFRISQICYGKQSGCYFHYRSLQRWTLHGKM
jgi:hypothetical protein